MRRLFLAGPVLFFALFISFPAQAQTLEDRVTALEAQMTNVENLVVQVLTVLGQIQPDIAASVNALAIQEGTLNGVIADLGSVQNDVRELQSRLTGVSRNGDTLLFTDMNLQVVSGSGATNNRPNGKGNIIIGYNEDIFPFLGNGLPTSDKSGSHYLIVGQGHNYSSFGGIVSGLNNVSGGSYASVSGGQRNRATGFASSVTGGDFNEATGESSSVAGGDTNDATGKNASVLGGTLNKATGLGASVSGGLNNRSTALRSTVAGGRINRANENYSAISGGQSNTATGNTATIGGGRNRTASGDDDWVAGGLFQDD